MSVKYEIEIDGDHFVAIKMELDGFAILHSEVLANSASGNDLERVFNLIRLAAMNKPPPELA